MKHNLEAIRVKADILDMEMRYAYFRLKLAEGTEQEDYWREQARNKAKATDEALLSLLLGEGETDK